MDTITSLPRAVLGLYGRLLGSAYNAALAATLTAVGLAESVALTCVGAAWASAEGSMAVARKLIYDATHPSEMQHLAQQHLEGLQGLLPSLRLPLPALPVPQYRHRALELAPGLEPSEPHPQVIGEAAGYKLNLATENGVRHLPSSPPSGPLPGSPAPESSARDALRMAPPTPLTPAPRLRYGEPYAGRELEQWFTELEGLEEPSKALAPGEPCIPCQEATIAPEPPTTSPASSAAHPTSPQQRGIAGAVTGTLAAGAGAVAGVALGLGEALGLPPAEQRAAAVREKVAEREEDRAPAPRAEGEGEEGWTQVDRSMIPPEAAEEAPTAGAAPQATAAPVPPILAENLDRVQALRRKADAMLQQEGREGAASPAATAQGMPTWVEPTPAAAAKVTPEVGPALAPAAVAAAAPAVAAAVPAVKGVVEEVPQVPHHVSVQRVELPTLDRTINLQAELVAGQEEGPQLAAQARERVLAPKAVGGAAGAAAVAAATAPAAVASKGAAGEHMPEWELPGGAAFPLAPTKAAVPEAPRAGEEGAAGLEVESAGFIQVAQRMREEHLAEAEEEQTRAVAAPLPPAAVGEEEEERREAPLAANVPGVAAPAAAGAAVPALPAAAALPAMELAPEVPPAVESPTAGADMLLEPTPAPIPVPAAAERPTTAPAASGGGVAAAPSPAPAPAVEETQAAVPAAPDAVAPVSEAAAAPPAVVTEAGLPLLQPQQADVAPAPTPTPTLTPTTPAKQPLAPVAAPPAVVPTPEKVLAAEGKGVEEPVTPAAGAVLVPGAGAAPGTPLRGAEEAGGVKKQKAPHGGRGPILGPLHKLAKELKKAFTAPE